MSHAELVERAARWLRGSQRCVFVMAEPQCFSTREIPDAIGWQSNGASILVECKTSVSDFRADGLKPWRRFDGRGLGTARYFLTPPALLPEGSLPDGWGLLEAGPKVVRCVIAATRQRSVDTMGAEVALLLNAVRRCHADPRIANHLAPFRHIEPAEVPT